MKYEELRKQYQSCQKASARLGDLLAKAKSGRLSESRLAECQLEIDRLKAELDEYGRLFAHLEETGDPVWKKLSGELDAALNEYQSDRDPLSLRHMARKLVGTISILILGTWAIDSLRKK